MRLRQAKKIRDTQHVELVDANGKVVRWLHPPHRVRKALRRIRKHENNGPKTKIRRDSYRLAAYIERNPKDVVGIRRRWSDLRERIVRDWVSDWDDVAYDYASTTHYDRVLRKSNHYTRPTSLYARNRLISDIAYYADRWCLWRVAFIDRHLHEMSKAG